MDSNRDTPYHSDTRNTPGAVAQTKTGVSRTNGGSTATGVGAVRDADIDGATERSVVARLSAVQDFSRDRKRGFDARREGLRVGIGSHRGNAWSEVCRCGRIA